MKKFISMVMAAAMVVSLVPATAFAANTATFKVLNAQEYTTTQAKNHDSAAEIITGAELRLDLKDVDSASNKKDEFEITLDFENAEMAEITTTPANLVAFTDAPTGTTVTLKEAVDAGDDSVTLVVTEKDDTAASNLEKDDVIIINLDALKLYLTRTSASTKATVTVSGDFGDSDALTFASVLDKGIKAKVKKTVDVAPEETATLKEITVEPSVGNTFADVTAAGTDKVTLKLSKGFEFVSGGQLKWDGGGNWTIDGYEDNEVEFDMSGGGLRDSKEFKLTDLGIEATDAKAGDVATLTIKVGKNDSVKLEVAKVVEEGVVIALDDEDEDVPVMWSGVNAVNTGLTADDDEHDSLEVTFKETFKGSLSEKDEFEFTLPEGVWVTGVKLTDVENGGATFAYGGIDNAFKKAYQEGDHESFKFGRRDFITAKSTTDEIEFTMQFTLVADPGFEGDVTLTVSGDAFEGEAELVIAKFVSPWTVEAAQNDLIIDYRNTEVPTTIVVKEAEAGLWKKGAFDFELGLDKNIDFEDDATFEVNEESDMEIDADTTRANTLKFEVDKESRDEAAVITISDISLYMNRSLAAGAYDLKLVNSVATTNFEQQGLYAPDAHTVWADHANCKKECFVADVTDYSDVVKEGFVNIITAGRDQDDASFTKKVVVPVGEAYLVAGEETVTLDVPAYINAAGYTMLPVRAVATALGINNNNVIWEPSTKTVTILYGQRIITMQAGQKVIYVNGSAIPAYSAVEIKDGRTFVVLRDLATALGVTDVSWDPTTKTATLNGNK